MTNKELELTGKLEAAAAQIATLQLALQELLDCAGYDYMTDDELRYEYEQGNGKAPYILNARAALRSLDSAALPKTKDHLDHVAGGKLDIPVGASSCGSVPARTEDPKVGINLDGIPQPYSGTIVLLETIANSGAIAFFEDGSPTPNRELCLKLAKELRDYWEPRFPAKVAAAAPDPAAYQSHDDAPEHWASKAINVILWFYRRAKPTYGRLPFAEAAIADLKTFLPDAQPATGPMLRSADKTPTTAAEAPCQKEGLSGSAAPSLPPLPEPVEGGRKFGDRRLFTADQMREYGKQCRAASAAPVALDEREGMHASIYAKVWGEAGGGDAGRIALANYAFDLGRKAAALSAGMQIPEGMALVSQSLLDAYPEINPSNYDHDDACRLNQWAHELVLSAAPLAAKEGK